MFTNAFTWLGLVILLVLAGCYVAVYFLGKKISFGWWMFSSLILGLVVGAVLQLIFGNSSPDMAFAFEIEDIIRQAYINLLQLMVMPLVMVAIITGITKAGQNKSGEASSTKNLGKAMAITIATLLITCAIAALISILATSIFGGLFNGLVDSHGTSASTSKETTLTATIASIFSTTNILNTLSGSSILPIMFLALLFAIIILGMRKESPEAAAKLEGAIDVIYEFVMGLVDIVIGLAPYGVFAAIIHFSSSTPFADYVSLGVFVVVSYVAMIVMFALHLIFITFIGGISPARFFRNASRALMIGFTTRSSMATLPVTIESMRNIGVDESIATFAGTFGTCVGQNGCGGVYPAMLATLVYIYRIGGGDQWYLFKNPGTLIMLIIIVTVCSLGIAGVGGGATAAGLMVFGILGFDVNLIVIAFSVEALIDMGRTFLNVSDGMVAGIIAARLSGNMGAERKGGASEGGEAAAQ